MPDNEEAFELLAETVAALDAELKELQKKVTKLDGEISGESSGPYLWRELTGKERRDLWDRLYDWVRWLEERYLRPMFTTKGEGVPQLAADWYRHPVAVELFTALMVAHDAAYKKKSTQPTSALVDWHERALWPTLARMEKLKLFPPEAIDKDWEGPSLRPARPNDVRFNAWADADVDEHPDKPKTDDAPPPPTDDDAPYWAEDTPPDPGRDYPSA